MYSSYTGLATGILRLLLFVWSFLRNNALWCWGLVSSAVNQLLLMCMAYPAEHWGTGLVSSLEISRKKPCQHAHIFCQLPDRLWAEQIWIKRAFNPKLLHCTGALGWGCGCWVGRLLWMRAPAKFCRVVSNWCGADWEHLNSETAYEIVFPKLIP